MVLAPTEKSAEGARGDTPAACRMIEAAVILKSIGPQLASGRRSR